MLIGTSYILGFFLNRNVLKLFDNNPQIIPDFLAEHSGNFGFVGGSFILGRIFDKTLPDFDLGSHLNKISFAKIAGILGTAYFSLGEIIPIVPFNYCDIKDLPLTIISGISLFLFFEFRRS